MPYYVWHGIDSANNNRYGKTYARNIDRLRAHLGEQNIKVQVARLPVFNYVKPIPKSLLVSVFENMHSLLQAGLRVDEALELCGKTVNHNLLPTILSDSALAIREGISLDVIFSEHVPWLDNLLVPLMRAGHELGSFSETFKMLELHYKIQEELSRKLKSALFMPLITLLFFLMITIIIFIAVIPRFEMLFGMFDKPVPGITKFLFKMSYFIRNWFWLAIFFIAALIMLIQYLIKKFMHKRQHSGLILKIPLIGKIIRYYSMTLFLQSLAVLLEGRIHLVKAIELASQTIRNKYIQDCCVKVSKNVESGRTLSSSFRHYSALHAEDIESLCALGEAVGNLDVMTRKAALIYHTKTYAALSLVTSLIPPFLIMVLGFFIAVLIFSVYAPLLTLSRVIG